MKGLEVKIANTQILKEDVYRFRYRTYVEEMKRPIDANHRERKIESWLDAKGTIFYVKEGNEIIATARFNSGKDGEIELEEEYEASEFKPYYPNHISTITSFMILPKYRGSLLAYRFTSFLYEFLRKNNIAFDFINTNNHLLAFYKKIGYREYKKSFIHGGYGEVTPMVSVIRDVTHLKKVGSPLYRLACKYKNEHKEFKEFFKKKKLYLF
jgi:ribosomal protein S18 acetylase RimI-like enzyme